MLIKAIYTFFTLKYSCWKLCAPVARMRPEPGCYKPFATCEAIILFKHQNKAHGISGANLRLALESMK